MNQYGCESKCENTLEAFCVITWETNHSLILAPNFSVNFHNFTCEITTLQWQPFLQCQNRVQVFETLRNRTAGRFRKAEWQKNVARDCTFPVLRDICSSFCRSEPSCRPVFKVSGVTDYERNLSPMLLIGNQRVYS